jgi:hypothetical protein
VIRLLLAIATAGAVVWGATHVDFERWREPAADAGSHLRQAVRAVAPAAREELREALASVASEKHGIDPASLTPEPVRAPAGFGDEAETAAPLPSERSQDGVDPEAALLAAAALELVRAEPLTPEETGRIRSRLDRVMALANGSAQ